MIKEVKTNSIRRLWISFLEGRGKEKNWQVKPWKYIISSTSCPQANTETSVNMHIKIFSKLAVNEITTSETFWQFFCLTFVPIEHKKVISLMIWSCHILLIPSPVQCGTYLTITISSMTLTCPQVVLLRIYLWNNVASFIQNIHPKQFKQDEWI